MDTDIQRIRKVVESETGFDLDVKSRKRGLVHARRMYYKILKLYTNMSLDAIGKTLKTEQNHATVLHQIKMFDNDFEHDKVFNAKFRRIINIIEGVVEISEEDKLKEDNMFLRQEIRDLKKEIKKLTDEVKYLRPKAIQPRNQQTKVYHCTEGLSSHIY